MKRNLIVTGLVAVIIAAFVLAARFLTGSVVPPVDGYMEGRNVLFIHTEASDPQIAQLLTKMKGSPVLVVPALAQAPDSMLANVYVFKNGVKGGGPLDFQPDVFDSPPGTSTYQPLRRLNLVSWNNPQAAREFKSAAEVTQALAKGEITVERPGVVVNMPMLTWPDGHR